MKLIEVLQTPVNILWYKRDLRLRDHAPLRDALDACKPLVMLYIFEPSVMSDPHYSIRHWRFVYESLLDLNHQLSPYGTSVMILYGEVIDVFSDIHERYQIDTIYSHEETGMEVTYARDRSLSRWSRSQGISWHEYQNNGVKRGRRNRAKWQGDWESIMRQPIIKSNPSNIIHAPISLPDQISIELSEIFDEISIPDPAFQKGGEQLAHRYMNSFFLQRSANYSRHISKPKQSRTSCSRLSPYLAWGVLIYQAGLSQHAVEDQGWKEQRCAR